MCIRDRARTVSVTQGDNSAIHAALTLMNKGEVLVVDGGGFLDRAVWGELMNRSSITIGIEGVVIDGSVRDIAELRKLSLPVFSAGINATGPTKGGGGKIDVLICTTIIESGIDIPNANTLIVKDADNFGLSQLHQLRGRVGRSLTQAYAYFFTSEFKDIKGKAKERITALQSTDSFNAGLALAMRDLEIRGAGEILGEKQSGLVNDVGLNLFSEMIKKAKYLLKGMPEDKIIDTSINLNIPAYIENDYLPQAELRLEIYKRLAECKTQAELVTLKDEIIDRFGPDGVSNIIKKFSLYAVKFQSGFIYQYAFIMLLGFSILLTFLIIK